MSDSLFARAPAVHTRTVDTRVTPLRDMLRRYAKLVELPAPGGRVDPLREQMRAQALARGNVPLSSIAAADGPLKYGHTAWGDRRRQWRFRVMNPTTARCVFEQIVESETPEGARHVGTRLVERQWRKLDAGPMPDGLVGTVMAL